VESLPTNNSTKIIVTNQDDKPVFIGFQEAPRPAGKSSKTNKGGLSKACLDDSSTTDAFRKRCLRRFDKKS
jgi:hypothetical protein